MYTVHHIALSVKDLSKSVAFYETFDFRQVGSWEDEAFRIINLRNGNTMLELFCYKTAQPLPEHAKDIGTDLLVIGVKHFALQVDSIDNAKTKLEAKGLEILNEDFNQDRSGANYFFVRDPDGILLEIIEDNRSY